MTGEKANEQEKKGMPWWGWAIIVVVALGGISNLFGGGNDSVDEQSPTEVVAEAALSEPEETGMVEEDVTEFANETAGEENARESADSYLSYSAFSRSGLIDQLLYEGFSQSEAEYGVDALGADWEQQAALSAAEYLAYSAFSRQGLIDQLVYEGFSDAEAAYGVDTVGADWNEQAALSAAEYLEYSSFSRQGLIDQLVYEGFSQAEAEYGVSQNGF